MTHKEKDCVERPRSSKKAAWKSGVDIAPDEVVLKMEEHGKVSYDAKRDQWQGYDPTQYKHTIDRYERAEAERRKYKQEQKEKKRLEEEAAKKAKEERRQQRAALKEGGDNAENGGGEADSGESDSGSDYDSDEDDDSEDDTKEYLQRDEKARDFQGRAARQGGVGGAQMKTTVRNLRIREDTPKYLRNLDLNSAHYDPKARSMRMNPLPNENPEDLPYAGDNFVRYTGDAIALAQSQVLCWEMQSRGEDIDVLSNPSQAELVKKQYVEKKALLEEKKKQELYNKYGVNPESNTSSAPEMDPRLRLGQSEAFVTYTSDGRLAGSASAKTVARTKYEEDVFINNHTSVWGSYFNKKRMQWGYQCCHSLVKNSYCTGAKGRETNDAESSQGVAMLQAQQMLNSIKPKDNDKKESKSRITKRSDVYGESDPALAAGLDESKVQAAMQRLKEEKEGNGSNSVEGDDRKRSYNSMKTVDVTAEDMEAYRRIKTKREDPMAAFIGEGGDSEVLLEYKP
eukprot:CAMPEP_0185033266 /NCGR_PEP_ID=MMETSP1103-20130426/22034_1 /TAXON_ID=36769 /ORGANISM="Paraphysomonas bandaiensis, Strain Caron Lab Isolate" /LENGTH=511 /DNA_ID=CAMNT_0027569477 /DNA_START=307 /DNA_END=1842 /DNA_ORIENTATION=-